jgi:hypothetical protein
MEKRHLSRRYREAHDDYKSLVPFLVSLLKAERMSLEIVIPIAAPAILFFVLIWAQ